MAALINKQKEQLNLLNMLGAFRGRRVLVTGATGFVGLHLSEALLDLGAEVYGLSRSADQDTLPASVRATAVNLCDLSATRKSIKTIKPDVIYHLAGLVDTRQSLSLVIPIFNNNLAGSVNLFSVLAETGCNRLIVVGSSEEPDVSHFGSSPNSPYAAAKDAETSYARMFHKIFSLPTVISRPFMSYGPRQPIQKVIPYTITSLLAGNPPKIGSGKRICDLIYIQDLVMGLLLAGFKPGIAGELIDIGTGVGTSIHDAVNLIVELLGTSVKPLFGAMPDRLYEYPQIADIEKTVDLLGYRPACSLRNGLEATIEWYRYHTEFHRQV